MRRNIKNKTQCKVLILIMILGAFTAGTLAFSAAASEAEQSVSYQIELPPPDFPQPQFFCGYCHVLTYPGVVKKGYELWKKGKHNKYGCVTCHYPPWGVERPAESMAAEAATKIQHIPQKPPAHFSYIQLGGEIVKTRPRIVDASCMTASCHGNPKDDFKTKRIKFTEKVPFVHKPHLEKKNQIEGQTINCTSCHQHETDQKKFEVSKAACHLCHFTNVKFNQGRSRCELCHELPQKPIQTSGQEPITHQILKEAKVSCGSCHYDLIQASGRAGYEVYFKDGVLQTALILGAGKIKVENCRTCHDQAKAVKEDHNKKLMHQKHVTIKTARCLDCHQPVIHRKAELKKPLVVKASAKPSADDKLKRNRFITDSCSACHPDPHRLQRLLSAGMKRKGVPETPGFHLNARANCMACHVEMDVSEKGEKILKASAKACTGCHKGRQNLLRDWKADLDKLTKETREVEKEALEVLAKVKSKLSAAKLAEAQKFLEEGREALNMVRFGNGVHNKKYAMFLLDAAMTSFYNLIDSIEESQQKQ